MKKGFTLIELMLVISIIAILSGIILASLSTSRTKGQNATIQSEVIQLRNQIELSWNGSNYTVLYGASGAAGSAPVANAALFNSNINSIVLNLLAQNGLSTTTNNGANYGGGISSLGICPLYFDNTPGGYVGSGANTKNAFTILTNGSCTPTSLQVTKYAIYAAYGPNIGSSGYYCIDSSGASISKTSGYIPEFSSSTSTPTCQ
jgi:prepilin-type N-terminal cleavage/methylation domain-containing protein